MKALSFAFKTIYKTKTFFFMKKILLIIIGCFFGQCLIHAQILNIEKFRIDKDTFNIFVGNVGLGVMARQQKTDVFTLSSKANAAYLSKKHSYLLLNTLSIVKVEGVEAANNGYAHLRFNLFRQHKISFEQFNQIQFDVGRGLDLRRLLGTSLRLRLIYNDKMSLAFNTGVMGEYERWNGQEVIRNTFFKSTSNITFQYNLSKSVFLFLISYYQARPQYYFSRPRFISDSRLVFNINKQFSFSFQFESTYDSYPIIDIQNHIYTIKNNLNFRF